MNKKINKGFTLAELLVVVAIIAVLVAIAIPVFSTQLEKAREATDLANIRSAYAELMSAVNEGDVDIDTSVQYIQGPDGAYGYYPLKNHKGVYLEIDGDNHYYFIAVEVSQEKNGWQIENAEKSLDNLFDQDDGDYIGTKKDLNDYIEYIKSEYGTFYYALCYDVFPDQDNPCFLNLYFPE